VVELAILVLWRGPAFPSVRLVEDVIVLLAFERGFGALVPLKIVEVFQEQQPGRLLGVIELSGTAGFLSKDVVDIFERLLEHNAGGFYCQGAIHDRNLPGDLNAYFIIGSG
jgi:hypothetical protein